MLICTRKKKSLTRKLCKRNIVQLHSYQLQRRRKIMKVMALTMVFNSRRTITELDWCMCLNNFRYQLVVRIDNNISLHNVHSRHQRRTCNHNC